MDLRSNSNNTSNSRGERGSSSLSFLTLNTNHRADLGGLAALLRDPAPNLVFLQEVAVSPAPLSAAVAGFGYSIWRSEIQQPRLHGGAFKAAGDGGGSRAGLRAARVSFGTQFASFSFEKR
jgi:hypothetical protein